MANTEPAVAPQSTPSGAGAGTTTLNLQNRFTSRLGPKQTLKYPFDLNISNTGKQTYINFQSYNFNDIQKTSEIYNIGNSDITKLGKNVLVGATGSLEVGKIPYPSNSILLYVPPGINVNYGASWGEASLGAVGAQSGSTGNDITDAIARLFTSGISSGAQASLYALASKMQTIPGFSAEGRDVFGLATGLVFNENRFSTFNNIRLRTFDYSFILVARSQSEMNEIQKIINTFKVAMHPIGLSNGQSGTIQSNSGGSTSFNPVARPPILQYPKLWTITYFIGDKTNRFIPKTKFCALTSLNLNYSPNSAFTTLTNGEVPAIQMDISFQELTTLTADQIIDGSILNGEGQDGLKIFTDTGITENYLPQAGGTF